MPLDQEVKPLTSLHIDEQGEREEREKVRRLRHATQFCKDLLEIDARKDHFLGQEEKMNFERCLTEHFLMKKGMDYFGKRDFIYIDMIGTNDAKMYLDVDF